MQGVISAGSPVQSRLRTARGPAQAPPAPAVLRCWTRPARLPGYFTEVGSVQGSPVHSRLRAARGAHQLQVVCNAGCCWPDEHVQVLQVCHLQTHLPEAGRELHERLHEAHKCQPICGAGRGREGSQDLPSFLALRYLLVCEDDQLQLGWLAARLRRHLLVLRSSVDCKEQQESLAVTAARSTGLRYVSQGSVKMISCSGAGLLPG